MQLPVECFRFETDDALASHVANRWLGELIALRQDGTALTAALPGGRIAGKFFTTFAASIRTRPPAALERLHFFWGDERCVPPEHDESNFRLASELLLEPLRIPTQRIHRILGEADPDSAAKQASILLRGLSMSSASGVPVLDWIILGMGEDGHVASLFPGEDQAAVAPGSIYRPVIAPKPPPRRITLDYPVIQAARQVWVLASGKGKQHALAASLSDRGDTPLRRVLAARPQTTIFTDIRD